MDPNIGYLATFTERQHREFFFGWMQELRNLPILMQWPGQKEALASQEWPQPLVLVDRTPEHVAFIVRPLRHERRDPDHMLLAGWADALAHYPRTPKICQTTRQSPGLLHASIKSDREMEHRRRLGQPNQVRLSLWTQQRAS